MPATPDLTDEQLLRQIRQGDTEAFDFLYQRYNRRLLAYLFRMLGNRDMTQDFLQDIFLKMLERPELMTETRRFSSWIFTVAHHLCISEYRKRGTRKGTVSEADLDVYADPAVSSHDIETLVDRREFQDALHTALDKLDEQRRSIFLLRHQEQFSIRDISRMTGCPEGTIKSTLHYTARTLARALRGFQSILL